MAVRSRLIDAQESAQQEKNRKKHRSSKSQDLNNLVIIPLWLCDINGLYPPTNDGSFSNTSAKEERKKLSPRAQMQL